MLRPNWPGIVGPEYQLAINQALNSRNMLRLRCFGGLILESTAGSLPAAALQRRRLALLALLAGGDLRVISREKLAAYLWPETDAERAKANLAQAMYMLRRELEVEDLFILASGVRLNPAVITSDVQEFDRALANSEAERAVELYRGPFLDGVFLNDAPEFEHWVDEERERLARRFAGALAKLASSAALRGAHEEAAKWWRAAAATAPTDSRLAARLIDALTASGDRAGALAYARVHETLLREELDVSPDAEFLAAVTQARVSPTFVATVPASSPMSPVEPAAPTAPDAIAVDSATLTARHHPVKPRRVLAATFLVGSAIAVLVALPLLRTRSRPPSPDAATPAIVAVLPFAVDSASDFGYLREGIPKLLGASLDGVGQIRSADERAVLSAARPIVGAHFTAVTGDSIAQRLGAQLFVLGDVFQSGPQLRIVATMYERPNVLAPIARRSAEGDTSQLFELVDKLARELVGARFRRPSDRLTAVASVTTHSLPAFRAYLEGERHMRGYSYPAAVAAFREAVALDTSFALAFHRLSEAADWTGNPRLVDSAAERAVAHATRLTERDRLLLDAMLAWRSGDTDRSEMVLENIVTHYPLDVDAWYQLGEVRFHSAPLRGRPLNAATRPFERTLELEPHHRGAIVHLGRLYAHTGRFKEADAMGLQLAVVENDTIASVNGYTVVATGSESARDALAAALNSRPASALWDFANRVALHTGNAREANRFARLFASRSLSPSDQALAQVVIAETEAAQGRFQAADKLLSTSARIPPSTFLSLRAALALLPFASESFSRAQLEGLRDSLALWVSDTVARGGIVQVPLDVLDPAFRAYPLGLLSARLGDNFRAAEHAGELTKPKLVAHSRAVTLALSRSVHAELLRLAGQRDQALRMLVDSQPLVPLERQITFYGGLTYERWARAELLRELGRLEEALGWYNSLAVTSVHEIAYLAPSHLRRAQIHERRGDRTSAAYHYARFVELWAESDSALRPIVEDARRRAASLSPRSAPSLTRPRR